MPHTHTLSLSSGNSSSVFLHVQNAQQFTDLWQHEEDIVLDTDASGPSSVRLSLLHQFARDGSDQDAHVGKVQICVIDAERFLNRCVVADSPHVFLPHFLSLMFLKSTACRDCVDATFHCTSNAVAVSLHGR